jgi:hypothetical protein
MGERLWHPGDATPDGIAAALSSLCLLHCLALPLVLLLLPAGAMVSGLDHGPSWLHWLLIGIAAPASVWALRRGQALHHLAQPWLLALAGFLLMAIGALLHDRGIAEQVLTVTGGLVVAFAHWRNWRARPGSGGLHVAVEDHLDPGVIEGDLQPGGIAGAHGTGAELLVKNPVADRDVAARRAPDNG